MPRHALTDPDLVAYWDTASSSQAQGGGGGGSQRPDPPTVMNPVAQASISLDFYDELFRWQHYVENVFEPLEFGGLGRATDIRDAEGNYLFPQVREFIANSTTGGGDLLPGVNVPGGFPVAIISGQIQTGQMFRDTRGEENYEAFDPTRYNEGVASRNIASVQERLDQVALDVEASDLEGAELSAYQDSLMDSLSIAVGIPSAVDPETGFRHLEEDWEGRYRVEGVPGEDPLHSKFLFEDSHEARDAYESRTQFYIPSVLQPAGPDLQDQLRRFGEIVDQLELDYIAAGSPGGLQLDILAALWATNPADYRHIVKTEGDVSFLLVQDETQRFREFVPYDDRPDEAEGFSPWGEWQLVEGNEDYVLNDRGHFVNLNQGMARRHDDLAAAIERGEFDALIEFVEASAGVTGPSAGDLLPGVLSDPDLQWVIHSGQILRLADFEEEYGPISELTIDRGGDLPGAPGPIPILVDALDIVRRGEPELAREVGFRSRSGRRGKASGILFGELSEEDELGGP